jgi:anti-anti-sigma factor
MFMRRRHRNGISTSVDGATGFLELHGEVDITGVAAIEGAFLELVDRGVSCIVVDLSDAAFADSKAIEAVMRGGQSARRAGADVVAGGARGPVARAIEVCGLEHAMPVYASRSAAVAATGASGGAGQ